MQLTHENLLIFFSSRPQLTAHGTAIEAGISPRLMDYILKGERRLTDRTIDKLTPVLVRYGLGNEMPEEGEIKQANGLERSSDKCHIQNVNNNEVAGCCDNCGHLDKKINDCTQLCRFGDKWIKAT